MRSAKILPCLLKYANFRKIIIFVFCLFIFVSANFQLYKDWQNTPPGTVYFGATGFFFDYYQFLSWIRDGTKGKILVSCRYIPSHEPPVLVHTFFSLTGFITSFLHLEPYLVYHLFRNLFLATWILSFWILVKIVFAKKLERYLAFFLILASSAFPVMEISQSSLRLSPLISFWKTFYTLEKFAIPPHHLWANTFFLLLIVLIVRNLNKVAISWRQYAMISLVSLAIALSNPGAMTFLLMILGLLFILALLKRKEEDKKYIRIFLVIFLTVAPFFLYYWQVFNRALPWKYYYYGEKVGRYNVGIGQYIGSLGPLFLTALMSFLYLKKFRYQEKILASWLILPIVMFPFVGRQLPFAMSRLFALTLFIPSSLLTIYFFTQFKTQSVEETLARWMMVVFLVVSLSLGFVYSFGDVYGQKFVNYYNVFLPKELLEAIDYLKQNSHSFSTVLAGENISNLIPAFANNHVVLGRQDAYANYEDVEKKVGEIYLRQITDEEIFKRLRSWNVQYLIFGLDQVGYEEFLKKGTIPQLRQVYKAGNISVVEVL